MDDDANARVFFMGIRATLLDGEFNCQIKGVNQGVPAEVLIMQLRAFVRDLERQYFHAFDEANR